jgi:hypothetical protein
MTYAVHHHPHPVQNQVRARAGTARRGHVAPAARATKSIATTCIRAGRRVIERAQSRPKPAPPHMQLAAAGRSGSGADVGHRTPANAGEIARTFHNLNYPNRLNDVRNAPHPCNRTSTRQKAVQRRSALGCLGPSDAAKPATPHAAAWGRGPGGTRTRWQGKRRPARPGYRAPATDLQNPAGWVSRIFPPRTCGGS